MEDYKNWEGRESMLICICISFILMIVAIYLSFNEFNSMSLLLALFAINFSVLAIIPKLQKPQRDKVIIKNVKDVIFCPVCGTINSKDRRSCNKCETIFVIEGEPVNG